VSAPRPSSDPLQTVHAALEQHDCGARGPIWKASARCPAHDDREPSLAVSEGADGRALLHCHAGCATRDVIAALGLTWSDLFPPGHDRARANPILAKPRPAVDRVLDVFRELGISYRCTRSPSMWVADVCPGCGVIQKAVLWVHEDHGRVRFSCTHGCPQELVLDALAGTEKAPT